MTNGMSINNSNMPLSKIVIKLQGSPKIQILFYKPLLLFRYPRNAEPRFIITYKMEQLSRQFPVQLLDEERIVHMFFRNQIIPQLLRTNADIQTPFISTMHNTIRILPIVIKHFISYHHTMASIQISSRNIVIL